MPRAAGTATAADTAVGTLFYTIAEQTWTTATESPWVLSSNTAATDTTGRHPWNYWQIEGSGTVSCTARFQTSRDVWLSATDWYVTDRRIVYTLETPNIEARCIQTNDIERAYRRAADSVWAQWTNEHFVRYEEDERAVAARQEWLEEHTRRQQVRRAKARQILRAILSEAQRRELDERGTITVVAQQSQRRYRVLTRHHGERHGNVEELNDRGQVIATLCCAPRGDIPFDDALAGQVLALQYDEPSFRKEANFTVLHHDFNDPTVRVVARRAA